MNLRTSTNGGHTWTAISGPHSDQHAMDWDPHQPGRIYLGNDGGMYRSDTNGVGAGTWIEASNQPWNESYHLAVSQQDSQRLATGLQDNGSVRSWTAAAPSPTDPALKNWNAYGGGDGHWNVIDPVDQSYCYECFQPSPPRHSCGGVHDTATGTTNLTISNNGWPANQRWTTDTPIVVDPNDDAVIYLGGTVLGRSANRGGAFTMISPADDANSLPGPDYTASTTANVISSAGDAMLSVSDPGHLLNGTFALPSPLSVALSKTSWDAPVSNDPVTVAFKQHIGATDALRTGSYSKTLTFTLSTTNP